MELHSRAFTFVDRITSLAPKARITGRFTIPSSLAEFPQSVISEAIGQLAAWSAMVAVDFKGRPVAGLAGCVELLGIARPGQTLELAADLESVDDEAVSYGGAAFADGKPLVRLHHCVGPMVPMTEFADPVMMRARFEELCGDQGVTGGFAGLPPLALAPELIEPGRCVRARFVVPTSAPLFADHFPRRPVFPGSLLMHLKLRLVAALAATLPPPQTNGAWSVLSVNDVKLRAFIAPGENFELEAKLQRHSGREATVLVQTRNGPRVIGSARVELIPELSP